MVGIAGHTIKNVRARALEYFGVLFYFFFNKIFIFIDESWMIIFRLKCCSEGVNEIGDNQ